MITLSNYHIVATTKKGACRLLALKDQKRCALECPQVADNQTRCAHFEFRRVCPEGDLNQAVKTAEIPRCTIYLLAPNGVIVWAEHELSCTARDGVPIEGTISAMKFINYAKYGDLDKIARARAAHFAYADRLREHGKLAIGGPLMDDQGQRIRLLFVYEAVSRDEALAFAQEDPFAVANAWSGYEISEWRLRGANLDLLIEANRAAHQSGGENTQSRMFVNYAKYATDKSRLATVRPAHWEYDRTLRNAGKLAMAGPLADDEGGLFVYNAVSREEAMSYLKQDPSL
jgi:uncharacterized protein YciI